MSTIAEYFEEVANISRSIDKHKIDNVTQILVETKKKNGRVFVLGIGGSASNATHMVNDLRKLCLIEAYSPTDNVSELTARINDDGFDTFFVEWLKVSKLNENDILFILSVGGGDKIKNVSVGLINAVEYAVTKIGCLVTGIVGKSTGYMAKTYPQNVIVVPEVNISRVTPHSEAFQAVVWHCIVSDPRLQQIKTKW